MDPALFGANTGDAGISGVKGDAEDDADAGNYCEGTKTLGYNIVVDQHLKEFDFDKGQFKGALSVYLKKVVGELESKNQSERYII